MRGLASFMCNLWLVITINNFSGMFSGLSGFSNEKFGNVG